jgi:uncharacterized protein
MPRPMPKLDSVNRPFWTGGAEGKLMIARCQDCGTYLHPPQPVCRHCLSERIAAEAVPGTATVETFTVNYQAWYPGLDVPYVIARVSLDGAPGVILTTNIVGCAPESVEFGDRVRVKFEPQGDIYFPLFEKIG